MAHKQVAFRFFVQLELTAAQFVTSVASPCRTLLEPNYESASFSGALYHQCPSDSSLDDSIIAATNLLASCEPFTVNQMGPCSAAKESSNSRNEQH